MTTMQIIEKINLEKNPPKSPIIKEFAALVSGFVMVYAFLLIF